MITWGEPKRRTNLKKHGFDFGDAEQLFEGRDLHLRGRSAPLWRGTVRHAGLVRGIAVSIVHTEEGDHLHVISMRKATKRERKIYVQSVAN